MAIDVTEFGSKLRAMRMKKGLGLRELASKTGISHAFLSRVECGKQTPPAEEKLRALANELDSNADVLLAMAGRLPADVVHIIQKHPQEYMDLLRGLRTLSSEQLNTARRLVISTCRLKSGPELQAVLSELVKHHVEIEKIAPSALNSVSSKTRKSRRSNPARSNRG